MTNYNVVQLKTVTHFELDQLLKIVDPVLISYHLSGSNIPVKLHFHDFFDIEENLLVYCFTVHDK